MRVPSNNQYVHPSLCQYIGFVRSILSTLPVTKVKSLFTYICLWGKGVQWPAISFLDQRRSSIILCKILVWNIFSIHFTLSSWNILNGVLPMKWKYWYWTNLWIKGQDENIMCQIHFIVIWCLSFWHSTCMNLL